MQITIGDKVLARDREVGTVDGFLFDARTRRIEHLLVSPGLLQGERALPIESVLERDERGVIADLDEDAFKELSVWNRDAFRARRTDYEGPPDSDLEGVHRGEFLMDETVAVGSVGYMGNKPFGYPGGEQLVPDDRQASEVRKGTDVVDVDGEKVGDVASFAIDSLLRTVTRLTVRKGLILGEELEIPVDWFDRALPERVVLSVSKAQVDSRAEAA